MVDLVSVYNQVRSRLNGDERPLINNVLEDIQEAEKPFLYIVKAPTGYGKTAISISCAIYSVFDSSFFPKVVHILPMRSIVEDIHFRASMILDEAVKSKMMDVKEETIEVFHLFPLNVTTIDTFTWDMMKLNTKKITSIRREEEFGYDYLTQGSLLDSLLFFDEAHYVLEDENMKAVFAVILELILKYKTSLIISTATISKGYEEYFSNIARAYGYDFKIFQPNSSDPFIMKESKKNFNIQLVDNGIDIVENVSRFVNLDKVNLVVANSPLTAIKIYDILKASSEVELYLLHGNMKKTHREKVLESVRRMSKNKNPSIIVTTQVIEAGVDISSDVLITEISVVQSLLQRMGRVARYDEDSASIYILKSSGKPYPADKIKKTWEQLSKNIQSIHPRIPSTYYDLLNEVHGRYQQEADLIYSPYYISLKPLSRKLLYLYTRSPEILSQIEYILKHRPFLREFTIPVKVDDEFILFSPKEVEKMFQEGSVEVKVDGETISSSPDFYELAKEFALGKKAIEVVYTRRYDCIRGVIS